MAGRHRREGFQEDFPPTTFAEAADGSLRLQRGVSAYPTHHAPPLGAGFSFPRQARGALLAGVHLAAGSAPAAVTTVEPEIVTRQPEAVGNLTFTPEGRAIFSHHPMFGPNIRVAEMTSATTFRPFPNEEWNQPRPGTDYYLDSVLGLRGDEHGVVWMLDIGSRTHITPKIVAWNTRTDQLERIFYLRPPATVPTSEPNDLVLDSLHGMIYIADEGAGPGGDGSRAALIVVDMRTGETRRLLEGHASTRAEDIRIHVDGRDLVRQEMDGMKREHRVGVDGIALDLVCEWLYYGPLSGRAVYRLRVADLLDHSLTDEQLGARVERYADKPISGGMSLDAEGNLYLTEVEARAVGVIPPVGRVYQRIASHPEMHWPDGISYAPDGFLHVTADQLPLGPPLHDGVGGAKPPFLTFRFRPLAPGRLGH